MIITNACGGMNPGYTAGDIMLIEDHINLMGTNPLIGPNHSQGTRFPDMSEPYSAQLRRLAADVAKENDATVHSECTSVLPGRASRPTPNTGCFARSARTWWGCQALEACYSNSFANCGDVIRSDLRYLKSHQAGLGWTSPSVGR